MGVGAAIAAGANIVSEIASTLVNLWIVGSPIATSLSKEKLDMRANQLYRTIIQKINSNNNLKEQLVNAFNAKQTNKLTSLALASPIGAAYQQIKSELDQDLKDLQAKTAKINEESKRYETAQNLAQQAQSRASEGFWNKQAAEKLMTTAEQAMNGGLQDSAKTQNL